MAYRVRRIKTLSTDNVAWLLGTDNKTVCRWADSGIIKTWRITRDGNRRFLRSDVASLLARIGA